ncbi:MAG TPA: hypothetical protein QF564_16975 [Pirellulaceae bacterium]|jgi:hypothetical protein|nr:hypothetical protein [Pirellulaceae bacterium]
MVRIAVCFMLLAGTAMSAFADDDPAGRAASNSKPPSPKSFVIELTRLELKDSTSDSAAGLNGAQLDAQIRQWRESDQIAAEESISLTSVENFESTVQFGRRLAVVTGTSSFGGGRSARQSTWQDLGTLIAATISTRDGHIIAELSYESSRYEPSDDENTPGETLTTTLMTGLFLRPGEQQVVTSSQADDHVVLLVTVSEVTVSEIGQARVTRRSPPSRSSAVRRSSPGRTPSSRTPSSRTSPPRSSASGQDRYAAFVQSVIERYDKNDDGFLDKGESTPLREEFIDYDLDEDGKLTADELMKYYMKRIER